MNKDARIFVAGHRGMVGSALVRRLTAAGYGNLVARVRSIRWDGSEPAMGSNKLLRHAFTR